MPQPSTGPPSLYALAKSVLIKYINTIEDVGEMEYRILEPVLKKITSPYQLVITKKLEQNSPQIAGEDAELWKKFIARDFGMDAVDRYVPQNPKSWSKVYDKHQRSATIAATEAAERLKAQFSSHTQHKESARTRLVNPASLPPIRKSRGPGTSSWGQSANNWDAKVGSKTKNIIQRARREAAEISRFQGKNSKLGKPMKDLQAGGVSERMKERIRNSEDIKQERERTVIGIGEKRKSEMLEDEDDEEQIRRAEEFRRKANERRVPVVTGTARGKVQVERKAADPFFRPKRR